MSLYRQEVSLTLTARDKNLLDPLTRNLIRQAPHIPENPFTLLAIELWALDRGQRKAIAQRMGAVHPNREIKFPENMQAKDRRIEVVFKFIDRYLSVISGMGVWLQNEDATISDLSFTPDSMITIWKQGATITGKVLDAHNGKIDLIDWQEFLGRNEERYKPAVGRKVVAVDIYPVVS